MIKYLNVLRICLLAIFLVGFAYLIQRDVHSLDDFLLYLVVYALGCHMIYGASFNKEVFVLGYGGPNAKVPVRILYFVFGVVVLVVLFTGKPLAKLL